MRQIVEYLLGKHSKAITYEISWEELYDNVSYVKNETKTKLIGLFTKYFPESFGGCLIEFLNGLNDDGFKFKIGEGGTVVINHKTKLVKLESTDENWDTISLYVTIYNVPKHNAIMIKYDNYFYTINVYVVHYKYVDSMIEFCDQDQWEENNIELSIKVKNPTESSYAKFEKLLNEVK